MEVYLEDSNVVKLYDQDAEGSYYYVMSTPRNRALQAKNFFEENGVEAIVPLHYQDVVRRGKTTRELVAALDNLIYIEADLDQMRWIKKHLPYLTYVKIEGCGGKLKKHQVYIEREIVNFFKLLEKNYPSDLLIVNGEDVTNDDFIQIYTKEGIFKDMPLFFENVKGVDHKCLTMVLDYNYNTVVAVKTLTPESFMMQECEMVQTIDGESIKTNFPIAKVAN